MAADLTFRTRRILYAVITEYISSGEPVGSRRLSKRYGINLSPATIRNVLADLEDAGYLRQPHTSAGRVPTDAGFRVFVEALVQMREVTVDDKAAILDRMKNLSEADDLMREAGRLLSSLTGAAAVVAAPKPEEEQLAQLRFMPLREGQVLAVLVTRSGAVQNRVVRFLHRVEGPQLERLNNYLDEVARGRTLKGVRDALAERMRSERDEYEELRLHAHELLEGTIPQDDGPREVFISGQGRLFERAEFLDVEKIRGFLRAFEDRERLLSLLEQTLMAGGVRVVIGEEADLDGVEDVSVISSSYRTSGTSAGTLGVIGPARMDYAKVVPLVGFTAQVVSEILDQRARDKDDA